MPDIPTGRICWYELLTNDELGSKSFYSALVGWDMEGKTIGDQPYTVLMNGTDPLGGVMSMPGGVPEDIPPHWLMYVSTPDCARFAAKAKEAGATVLNEIDVPDVGRIAILTDPAGGACFAAYQPGGRTPGHDGPAKIGEFSWHEGIVDDLEKGWAFYSEMCGWHETGRGDMGPIGTYLMFGRADKELGGIYKRPPEMPIPAWLCYIRVDDVKRVAPLVTELGGEVFVEPMEVPGGDEIAICRDPQGANFAIHSTANG